MSADDAIRPRAVVFRMVGEGLAQTFKCGECQRKKSMHGRRKLLILKGPMRGMRDHVCTDCQKERPQ